MLYIETTEKYFVCFCFSPGCFVSRYFVMIIRDDFRIRSLYEMFSEASSAPWRLVVGVSRPAELIIADYN